MKIVSLNSFEGIAFGAHPDALHPFGTPERQRRNPRGEDEFEFHDVIFRFGSEGFVEASFAVNTPLEIDGHTVAPADLREYLRTSDPEYFEYVGFAVAPQLGIGYDLSGSNYATACKEGRWDGLKEKAKNAVPFKWKPAVAQNVELGPPCPVCGKALRPPRAKICFACGWNGDE